MLYDQNPLCEMCLRNESVVFSSWFGRCVRCDATNGPYILAGLLLLCERAALGKRARERLRRRAARGDSPLPALVSRELLTRFQDLGLDAGETTTGTHWPERIAHCTARAQIIVYFLQTVLTLFSEQARVACAAPLGGAPGADVRARLPRWWRRWSARWR